MAWTAPFTATDGSVLTAADWNTYVRDNLNETAPAKATTEGRYFVATGQNAIAERAIGTSTVNTFESTDSSSYTDLTTDGPEVTQVTGSQAIVSWACQIRSASAGAVGYVSVDISGATSTSAADTWALQYEVSAANDTSRMSVTRMFTGLTPGSNTFTLKYRSGGSQSMDFGRRHMWVMPL
jgi:hypothetical protein